MREKIDCPAQEGQGEVKGLDRWVGGGGMAILAITAHGRDAPATAGMMPALRPPRGHPGRTPIGPPIDKTSLNLAARDGRVYVTCRPKIENGHSGWNQRRPVEEER